VLAAIGDLLTDVVVWTDRIRLGTDNPSSVHRCRGGSAANVAAAAASLVPARFIGRVGDGPAGDALVAELGAAGVDVRVQRGGRTGTAIVVVDASGERTMFPDPGASAELAPVDPAWLADVAVLHVPAYGVFADVAGPSLRDSAEVVRGAGGVVSVDVAAVSLVETVGRERFAAAVDALGPAFVFANRDEAVALGMLEGAPAAACTWVIKDGVRDAVARSAAGEVRVAPEVSPEVRDTTGAGDAFAAGFLAAWMQAKALEGCLAAGHSLAATVLATPGAERG